MIIKAKDRDAVLCKIRLRACTCFVQVCKYFWPCYHHYHFPFLSLERIGPFPLSLLLVLSFASVAASFQVLSFCFSNSLSTVLCHISCSLIVVYLFGLIITCLNNVHKYFLLKFLSFNQPHQILTLEQSSAGGGENSIDSCIYVYNGTKVGQVTIMCINISMHLLHTVLYTFLMVLIRRTCSTIKSFFWWWSFPLFSWP